ncbi:MAG: GNAT family N-acetyltransferase [Ktedonobacterales bacterium]
MNSTPGWAGKLVRLRGVEPADWETHWQWDQDWEMQRRIDRVYFPRSRVGTQRWAEQAALQDGAGDQYHFEVETLAGELVGVISASHCDARVGTYSHGLAILSQHQRKGYASEAILLLARYFFAELRYQKVNAPVYSFNEPSIRLHESLGFQPEGRQRRMVYTNGLHYDLLWYGMTAGEFATRMP